MVKELLQNDFFLEDTGLKVELASVEEEEQTNTIQLRLRVVDPKYVVTNLLRQTTLYKMQSFDGTFNTE